MSEKDLIEERKKKVINFLGEKKNWITYIILAAIVYLGVYIRTLNIPRLKDVATGGWTLGPDLDPFLFLRWAEYIVEHGKLMAIDTMRYVPLGFETSQELPFLPYGIAWFHNILSGLGLSSDVTYSAIIFPVFMFALTIIAFFLLTRKIFIDSLGEEKSNIIALISSFFLVVLPSLLPRTIAGIPEKESAAFFFLFAAFFFFLSAWKAKSFRKGIYLAVLAGIFTSGMALTWGGYGYIFLVLSLTLLISFLLGQIDKNKSILVSTWILTSLIIMILLSARYTLPAVFSSITIAPSIFLLLMFIIHFGVIKNSMGKSLTKGYLSKIPSQVSSFFYSLIVSMVGGTVLMGMSFVPDKINDIIKNLVKPATSRLIQTVAENRQPFFTEWANNFGPNLSGIPVFFWIFFVGSIYLFYNMVSVMRSYKERAILTAAYAFFLFSLVFSRYSQNSVFDGASGASIMFYVLGFIALIGVSGYYYVKYYREGDFGKLKEIDFGILFVFSFFFFSIVSARGAVRLIMVLVPSASIIASYFAVSMFYRAKESKSENKFFIWLIAGIIIAGLIFSGFYFYQGTSASAESFAPSAYHQQWQEAMSWVREETPKDAVFAHWWDYGYWVQSIGERATVLDGGNAVSYWNHLMGRHALTGTNETKALEFLYAHNVTNFLIDSTDIGKYSAYSTIGSDVNYDRRSFIPALEKDERQTQTDDNTTTHVFSGGFSLDGDIVYEDNGSEIFLPSGEAGIGAIMMEENSEGRMTQPEAVYIYNNQQFRIPLRYAASANTEEGLIDFGSGLEAGVFVVPAITGEQGIDEEGALLYLSPRTVKTQFAKLYLYGEEGEFELSNVEDDAVVSQIKAQSPSFNSDFVYYGGIRGPIKIWDIEYPEGIKYKEKYINTTYPEEIKRS